MPTRLAAGLLASVTTAVWEFDCRTGEMRWSPEFRALFGLPESIPASLSHLLDAIAPDDRTVVEQTFLEPSVSGLVAVTCRRFRGPEIIATQMVGRVFRADAVATRIVGFAVPHDALTDVPYTPPHDSAYDLLSRRLEEFNAVMDLLPIPVNIAEDAEARFIRGNAAFHDLFATSRGMNASVSAPPEQRPPWRCFRDGREVADIELPVQKCAALGIVIKDEPVEVRFDDGRRIDFLASALPLFDSQGVARGAVCVLIDVTERYEQDRHREQFVSMVSHELRQPLSALTAAVELLARQAGAVSAVRVAQRQVAHMTRVVDDLLDASRLTRRGLAMHVTDVSVSEVVQQAIEIVRPICERSAQQITLIGHLGADGVSGDPNRLRQVFVNLLHNASKFSHPNTVITVTLALSDDHITVAIRDQGLGIAPEQLPHVFDLFTNVSDPKMGGLGLGLHLVRSIVQLHHGQVHAESEGEGAGSTFIVRLPRLQQ